ncbi:enolase-phosphatase E1 [Lycorma delicatula]|uniref:enolase-phosphatase E1 n=1 Tax=Lycorma delicatula TaxID=130591 RepID=UPI003F51731F
MTTDKRSIDKDNLQFNVSTVIVDIEGTTTSINFVKDTLFPYVREHLEEYIKTNWAEKELQEDITLLRVQAVKDKADGVEGVVEIPEGEDDDVKSALVKNILWQMDNDRKTKALKEIQGHIWRNGYSSGKLIGHVFDDVKDCLKSWTEAGKKIYVYSSGSVEAQKLLFSNTKEGDLLSVFSGHFDTNIGAKTESSSYTKILENLTETISGAKDVLFLTDVPKEAQAAKDAGMQAVIVSREGNAPLTDDTKETFPVVYSFSDLTFEGAHKRKRSKKHRINDLEG